MKPRLHPFTASSRPSGPDAGKEPTGADPTRARAQPHPDTRERELTRSGRREFTRRLLCGAAVAGALASTHLRSAHAVDGVEVSAIRLEPSPDGDSFMLSADFTLTLPPRLEEAVNKGVVLYFLLEVELFEPRWYWWDEKVASASQTFRLSYHALTRQYRLLNGGSQQQFSDLGDALRTLGAVRDWRIVEAERIRYGARYPGQVRMRLDNSQLPKPFQLTAITNKDWTLQAEWKRFEFKP